MRPSTRTSPLFLAAVLTIAAPLARPALAQTRTAAPAYSAPAPSPEDTANTQQQLIKLLRLSPTLTSVVVHDPSLLADQAYVSRNNPELAQFLTQHPEVVRNPEFYLFSNLTGSGRDRDKALERAIWPDFAQPVSYQERDKAADVMNKLLPIIALPCLFLAVVWIIRLIVESRRTSRYYKMQTELHTKLIDKVGNNQDLTAYLESEAGKRLFAETPFPAGTPLGMPNAVARVITPTQIGIVMVLLGIGLLMLRNAGTDTQTPMTVMGTLALMPGIGFILSAAATWVLAKRLGLMPAPEPASGADAAIPGGDGGTHDRL